MEIFHFIIVHLIIPQVGCGLYFHTLKIHHYFHKAAHPTSLFFAAIILFHGNILYDPATESSVVSSLSVACVGTEKEGEAATELSGVRLWHLTVWTMLFVEYDIVKFNKTLSLFVCLIKFCEKLALKKKNCKENLTYYICSIESF